MRERSTRREEWAIPLRLKTTHGEKRADWSLVRRRACLVPTWRGWVLVLGIVGLVVFFLVRGIHPYLSVNAPLPGGVLVVEGWLADYAMRQAVEEFEKRGDDKLFVTGGPLEYGAPLSAYGSYAEVGAATLMKLGLTSNAVQAVPAPRVKHDRTYASALALKDWFATNSVPVQRLTLISHGPHARRSRLLFGMAFGKNTEIGILAVPPDSYEPDRWWRTSEGVRAVIGETLAYGYARFFFHPKNNQ